MDTTHLNARFAMLREAHARDPMPPWPVRAAHLKTLRGLLREHRQTIAEAINADFGGRSAQETELLEIFPSLNGIAHALAHGRRWMWPRRRWPGLWFLPARIETLPQPLGVVGIIVPWNYPLYLAVGPLIDALTAGNRVLLKLSEYTPRFSALFAELVGRTFAADHVGVIEGDADVARAFSALPFDHLLFTGSTAVGHQVMRTASDRLTPVTLELGGKSPAIVGPDVASGARFEHAVERILTGKLVNAGQTCIAPDYVLLPRAREAEFIAAAQRIARRLYPRPATNGDYTSIISMRHFERLTALHAEATLAGAQAHALSDDAPLPQSRRLPPVLYTGVGTGTRLMREEIFGPLLPLVPYERLDDAIAFVNARPHPLALYFFSDARSSIEKVLQRTVSGGVTINDTLLHIAQDRLPFGGVGASGMGAYHGYDGFLTFSKLKPVFRQSRLNAVGLMNPPYGRRFAAMLRVLGGARFDARPNDSRVSEPSNGS